jgi:hypothetical protein
MRPIALAANQSSHVGLFRAEEHCPARRQWYGPINVRHGIQGDRPSRRRDVHEDDHPAAALAACQVHGSSPLSTLAEGRRSAEAFSTSASRASASGESCCKAFRMGAISASEAARRSGGRRERESPWPSLGRAAQAAMRTSSSVGASSSATRPELVRGSDGLRGSALQPDRRAASRFSCGLSGAKSGSARNHCATTPADVPEVPRFCWLSSRTWIWLYPATVTQQVLDFAFCVFSEVVGAPGTKARSHLVHIRNPPPSRGPRQHHALAPGLRARWRHNARPSGCGRLAANRAIYLRLSRLAVRPGSPSGPARGPRSYNRRGGNAAAKKNAARTQNAKNRRTLPRSIRLSRKATSDSWGWVECPTPKATCRRAQCVLAEQEPPRTAPAPEVAPAEEGVVMAAWKLLTGQEQGAFLSNLSLNSASAGAARRPQGLFG